MLKELLCVRPNKIFACPSVAASPVEEFEVTMSLETSLTFSWSPPSTAHIPTGYRLTCTPLLKGISIPEALVLSPEATIATVTGLNPGVTYNCSIATVNPVGSSKLQTLTPTTVESGM